MYEITIVHIKHTLVALSTYIYIRLHAYKLF